MIHDDPEPERRVPEASAAYESLTLGVRWVDAEGSLHLTALSDGKQLRYVGHLARLLGGETPPYPEPAVEENGTDSPRLLVRWADGDASAFDEDTDALAYVLHLREVFSLPQRERWLHLSPEAMLSVNEGLRQAARGETRSLGSFARYAEGED